MKSLQQLAFDVFSKSVINSIKLIPDPDNVNNLIRQLLIQYPDCIVGDDVKEKLFHNLMLKELEKEGIKKEYIVLSTALSYLSYNKQRMIIIFHPSYISLKIHQDAYDIRPIKYDVEYTKYNQIVELIKKDFSRVTDDKTLLELARYYFRKRKL